MAETNDIQQDRLLDYLYGELADADAAAFEREVQQSPELRAELETLERTRDAARAALPDVEPPPALSNILLHEAARQASHVRGDDREGLWDRLVAWFQPLIAHPGLSAVAALVLFVAVVGTVGLSRVGDEAERASSQAAVSEGVAAEAAPADEGVAADGEAQRDATAQAPLPELAAYEEAESDDAYDEDDADNEDNGVRALSAELGDLASSGGRSSGRRQADLATDKEEGTLRRSRRERAKKPARKPRGNYGAEPPAPPAKQAQKKSAPADDAVGGLGKAERAEPVFADEVPEAAPMSRPQAEPKRSVPRPTQQRRAPAAPPPAAVPSGMGDMDAAADAEVAQSEQRRERARQEARHEQILARLRAVASKTKDRTRRCQEVARLANDLRDRDGAFYKRRVATDSAVRGCAGAVRAERLRRERSRLSNRPKAAEPAAEPAADEK